MYIFGTFCHFTTENMFLAVIASHFYAAGEGCCFFLKQKLCILLLFSVRAKAVLIPLG